MHMPSSSSSATILNTTTTTSNLIVKLLADNLENRLQKAGAILNVTSKLPQVRNTSFAYLLNQTSSTLHGIPQNVDVEKRTIAKNILASDKDLFEIVFIMSNGDIYFDEPYSEQKLLTTTNLAFRDYFQGAIKTNDIYMGNVIVSVASPVREALIAVPVYPINKDNNSTIVGIWAGGLDFKILSKELQSFNFTSAGMRVVYIGHNGNKVADSDARMSDIPESFANLTSFRNAAINGQSGMTIENIGNNNNTKMIVTYQPVKAFHNTWAVLLIQPFNQTIINLGPQ
jgi:cache domain-containing protein